VRTSTITSSDWCLMPIFRDSTEWKWLERSGTDESYAATLARFLCASIRTLVREQDRFRLPLPGSLKDRAQALLTALQSLSPQARKRKGKKASNLDPAPEAESPNPDPDVQSRNEAVLRLQDFLYSVVTESIQESQEDRFKCPVQAFIACAAYNEDDTFKQAHQVTSLLARLQFLLRCTALHYAQACSKAGGHIIP